jgi:soluble lytic murein transglycosylase-like protein
MRKKTIILLISTATATAIFLALKEKAEAYTTVLRWRPIIEKVIPNNLPSSLVEAIIWVESKGNPYLVGRDGEIGLMQVLPSTAQDLGVSDSSLLFDPIINIKTGVSYLKYQLDRYGNITDAVAAYNAGSARKYNGVYVNQSYVDKVMDVYRVLRFV